MDKNDNTIVMFLPWKIKTGGERYLAEIYDYFIKHEVCVYPVYLDDVPRWLRRFGLLFDCIYSNVCAFSKIRKYNKIPNIILFEDFHLHPRLVLCNIMMKINNKRFKIITLIQSSAFYHEALKNQFLEKIDKLAVHIFLKQMDKILCNSSFTQQEVIAEGVAKSKTDVVYCGIAGLHTRTVNAKKTNNEKTILFVGQCEPYKGLVYLLNAVSLLSEYSIVLNVVGNVESNNVYFKKLVHLRKDLSLEDRVKFHGHIYKKVELSRMYMESDIFVLSSLIEGFGIVLLEAMSVGLPIVATTAGSIPELVKDGQNGLLVPPANAEALAAALKRLMDSSELRQRLGANGRDFFESNRNFYSWNKTGERVLSALSKLR